MTTALSIAICCSAIAVLYAVVLASEDTPLNRWFRWLEWMADHKGWRSWIAKPIGACERCFAGQLALWVSVSEHPTAILQHLASAAWAVLFAAAIHHEEREEVLDQAWG